MDLTPEEVIAINSQDTLTPAPILEPTVEQKEQIRVLLEAGYSPSDVFTKAYLPIERAIVVQDEIAEEKRQADLLANPIIINEEIIE